MFMISLTETGAGQHGQHDSDALSMLPMWRRNGSQKVSMLTRWFQITQMALFQGSEIQRLKTLDKLTLVRNIKLHWLLVIRIFQHC